MSRALLSATVQTVKSAFVGESVISARTKEAARQCCFIRGSRPAMVNKVRRKEEFLDILSGNSDGGATAKREPGCIPTSFRRLKRA
jgi:hypothetical protein